MTRMTRMLGTITVLAVIGIEHVAGQTARVEGGVRSLMGVDFYWETRLVPPVPSLDGGLQMVTLSSALNRVHRVMVDRSRKVYFGYDARVTVIKTELDTRYRVVFSPLSSTPELQRILGPDAKTWTALPAPQFPPARIVRGGEVLELSLLANSARGQRMSEYVTLQEPRRQGFDVEPFREFAFASGSPRDFTAGDVELRLQELRVTTTYPPARVPASIAADEGTVTFKSAGDASGPIVWISVPGRGRFLLSLSPRSGFRRAGEVRGSMLRFIVDGQTYDVVSTLRIAPATAAFNLYVLQQPAWKPSYASANVDTVHIGSADRLEYLGGKE